MPDFSASVGELAGFIRAMFGLTRRNRLRDQIRETLSLFAAVAQYDRLAEPAERLAKVIELETEHLLAAHQTNRRDWNWASSVLSEAIAGLTAWGAIALWKPDSWYAILLFVLDVIAGGLFFIAGFGVLLQRTGDQ